MPALVDPENERNNEYNSAKGQNKEIGGHTRSEGELLASKLMVERKASIISLENSHVAHEDFTHPSQKIIELIQEVKALQMKHNEVATTKMDLSEIHEDLEVMQEYFKQFSVRKRMQRLTLSLTILSSLLMLILLLYGEVKIASPLPELLTIISLVFYIMARTLPKE